MKAKYNKSVIMKRAWVIYRKNNGQLSWSDSLKESWSIAKNGISAKDFKDVYKKYHGMVFYYVHGKIFNGNSLDVEEIVNDVFSKVYQNWHTYNIAKGKINTWILNIAKNCVIDLSRSKQYKKSSQVDLIDGYTDEAGNSTYEFDSHTTTPQEVMEGKELKAKIDLALSELDEKYRVPALMSLIDGMKQEKIAAKLDIPLNTVKTRIARAKQQLQESLKGVY